MKYYQIKYDYIRTFAAAGWSTLASDKEASREVILKPFRELDGVHSIRQSSKQRIEIRTFGGTGYSTQHYTREAQNGSKGFNPAVS